ncbi:MAG: FG-GAP repeat domain-containing protein [Candidatus Limnocylindrales bacterium]
MRQHRRAAWALVATLLATMSFAVPVFAVGGGTDIVPLVVDPGTVCSPGQLPTRWLDELHPPATVRVLRSRGPSMGTVETVPLWKYVGRVVRAEYSTGGTKPYPWMHIGALTVKQYAWYYAGHWRGGRVELRDAEGNITSTQCYDLKDTTADQIYTDKKADPANPGQWIEANVPTPANLTAMRETWHVTLRKWQADKNRSRFYLTGYRSGTKLPCGADSTGFKIYQKSLRDCGTKNLNFEEVLREYFEPGLIADTRLHDVLGDNGDWRGDLGMINPTSGAWALFEGSTDSFTAGPTETFASLSPIVGQGVGNVDLPATDGADDSKLFADLVMLTGTGSNKTVAVARATGTGFAAPTTQNAPSGASHLVVSDFNGDLRADAGILSTVSPGLSKLQVMRANGLGGFSDAVHWWTGPLDLSAAGAFVAAGDTNGDGKADLIMRNAAGLYSVANSRASCSDMTVWGLCPVAAVGAAGLTDATPWLSWAQSDVKHTVGDFDRDGRDDLVAVVKDGNSAIKVFGLRAKTDGTAFADPQLLWSGNMSFADVTPLAFNVNPDGMADLALASNQGGETRVQWLRTNERTTSPASMTQMTPFDSTLDWNANNRAF